MCTNCGSSTESKPIKPKISDEPVFIPLGDGTGWLFEPPKDLPEHG